MNGPTVGQERATLSQGTLNQVVAINERLEKLHLQALHEVCRLRGPLTPNELAKPKTEGHGGSAPGPLIPIFQQINLQLRRTDYLIEELQTTLAALREV